MARIARVEVLMVDLKPKVKRVDAIQSFVSQETPIVRITDADGVTGTGYSYTIGTGGNSVIELLKRTLVPAIVGREANEIEKLWRELLFLTHATTTGAITSIALATIDTALWDLKARKLGQPLHLLGSHQVDDQHQLAQRKRLHADDPDAPHFQLAAYAFGCRGQHAATLTGQLDSVVGHQRWRLARRRAAPRQKQEAQRQIGLAATRRPSQQGTALAQGDACAVHHLSRVGQAAGLPWACRPRAAVR